METNTNYNEMETTLAEVAQIMNHCRLLAMGGVGDDKVIREKISKYLELGLDKIIKYIPEE